MPEEESKPDAAQSGGLTHSLRRLASTLLEALHTRLELLATEIEEERLRILQMMLWGFVSLFFIALGVIMLTFFLVVLFWSTDRVLITFVIAAVYLAIGAALALYVRAKSRGKSRLFSVSLAELKKDRDQLGPLDRAD